MVKNGNFTFLLLELVLSDEVADVLADIPPVLPSSGQEWQIHISTVRAHIGRWRGRSTPQYWHLVVKNGDFTFLLLELVLSDEVADVLADLPPVLPSSGQEWQIHISTVRAHIGRWRGRSTPQYWHLVVKNGDFTFLLLELILSDEVADVLADLPPGIAI